nr:putative ribonuclease H-like domain-containing protein [Tanacetum cinerariifolium]
MRTQHSGLKRLKKVGPLQRVESSNDTVVDDQEDASKYEGEIAELDANEDVTLVDVDAEVAMDANIQGRMTDSQDKRKERQNNKVIWYQALKKKPLTEAQARKNMMVYLKNMARFKMDFFKSMTYSNIRPIFEKHYNSIQAFLEKGDKEIEEEGSKRKATHLALKVHVIDYQIHHEHNKPYYKIIRADGAHQLFLSFITLLKIFKREDLETLWKLVKERFKSIEPKNFSDDFLLNTLKIMFEEPKVEASVWRDQKGRYGLLKTLVDLPNGKRAIGTKWIYRNKKDERGIVVRNKARLVAQGYTQEDGIDYDEVFALVARIEAIRPFLAYALFKDFVVYQMDMKSAFLYGKIEDEVYVCQPLGFEDPDFPNRIYKVEKTLYVLHQAPKAWTASTPIETSKPLLMDENAKDVNVHLYRLMIGSLMYLTSLRPDIMFVTGNPQHEVVNFLGIDGFYGNSRSKLYEIIAKDRIKVNTGNSSVNAVGRYLVLPDKTVHEERRGRVKMAATTNSSLEAEQDSEFFALENNKTAQDLEIIHLKKRVKRRIHPTRGNDQDERISFVQEHVEIQGRYGHDTEINTASTSITTTSINITTAELVTTVSTPITTVGVSVSTTEPSTPPTTTPTVIEDEDLIIA